VNWNCGQPATTGGEIDNRQERSVALVTKTLRSSERRALDREARFGGNAVGFDLTK